MAVAVAGVPPPGGLSNGKEPTLGHESSRPQGKQPVLFFLFLVYVKINNEAIWDRFFAPAVQGEEYYALVHCKSEASCRENIRAQDRFQVIRSVETQYCFDLVSGMNALLVAALDLRTVGHPNDKFIFISDSTLPVKPFSTIRAQMTADAASDFCIFPRNEWAEVSENFISDITRDPVMLVAVKHHQWIVLSRQHAKLSVQKSNEDRDMMKKFQVNMGFKNTGCLDEFWHFSVLYHAIELSGHPAIIHLKGFNGEPLKTSNHEIQGRCDTFVHWDPRASGTANNITQLSRELTNDPGTDLMPPSGSSPGSIKRLSRSALSALRSSAFLFVRKVDDSCVFSGCDHLVEAFDSLVFASPPRPLTEQTGPVWRGQGVWLDNRRSAVTVMSLDGSVRITGGGAGMEAKGFYCNDRIDLLFANGFRGTATLSADGAELTWMNGVVWERASAGL